MSSATDEIKARVDLVELIGRSIALRRVGSSYRGLCPFHTEKTPSFYVFPHTHTWHCFGCGKSGTAFDWLMEREHLEFGEALRSLAHMTGVALPERRTPEEEAATRRLYDILAGAQTYYQGLLWGTAGTSTRAYLGRRGLSDETAQAFGLGYAPGNNGLLRFLESDGFSVQELHTAGVTGLADDGRPFDFFRDRLVLPIRDPEARIVAFGGRALEDYVNPKYLNSRDTVLFHKQETLFAFDMARRPMAQERQAVIVEGYMDVLMAHQHGYRNVVATLGTAVTDRQLRLLRRHVEEIVLALDADAAGQAATWRALQLADESLRSGLTPVVGPTRRQRRFVPDRTVRLRVLTLPGAKDPDELIRSDPTAWPALVRAAVPVIDFVLERLGSRHDLTSAQGKAAAAEEIGDVLAGIANPIEQAHYVQLVAERLRVDEAAVRQSLRRRQRTTRADRPDSSPPEVPTPAHVEGNTLDEYALALLLRSRELHGNGPPPGEFEFALPQSRAVLREFDSRVSPELEPVLALVDRHRPVVERLSPEELHSELEATRLRLRKQSLVHRKAQIVQLVREVADERDRHTLEHLLSELAQQINAVEQQLDSGRGGTW